MSGGLKNGCGIRSRDHCRRSDIFDLICGLFFVHFLDHSSSLGTQHNVLRKGETVAQSLHIMPDPVDPGECAQAGLSQVSFQAVCV